MRKLVLMGVLLLTFLLIPVGCEEGESVPTVSPTPTPTATPMATPTLTPTPTPTPTVPPLEPMALESAFPSLTLERLVGLTYPPDGSNRLFAVLQRGQIMVFLNDPATTSAQVFLDITDRVNSTGNEEGLLGLAFDPRYTINGYFYVSYTASSPRRSVISRFSVSQGDPNQADPANEFVILEVDQPYPNHNGGHIAFGPDGYLYIGLGDGGAAGDPRGNGQDRSTLLGSILRIDVSNAAPGAPYTIPPDNPFVGEGDDIREEIWAYGLRNPWRFSFDRLSGDLWAADVGQADYEEIDLIEPGSNYGWNIMEGAHCYPPGAQCSQAGLTLPISEYAHDGECSIIGGYVYRSSRLPSLYGAYLYTDHCSGTVWALRYDGVQVTEQAELVDSELTITAFGEDAQGEVYILSRDNGIYRLRPLP